MMKFFVLFVLFWGVLLGTALSLDSGEERQEIPVDQCFGNFEEYESKEELKKRESTLFLFGTITVDFLPDKSIDCSVHEAFLFPPLVDAGPNCTRAPPLSAC
ncbi:hypothetical protein CA11_37970 [Gimesia maris]|uniref:hypothetical protein n=1 Tax=Gimesia maris TaxID=122 RepID=UPI0011887406|nr:hypothetical protein [Gimesia maris]QDT80322.1 hypothetical protein Mal35_37930 [Gimesia maris]QDU15969.1 hypothetical protein CA11_37970 [Gimesia maris]|tara:strand:+ start:93763 stop:94068 length:306 start_codon:yes stop_codon:yes gene_type:complete